MLKEKCFISVIKKISSFFCHRVKYKNIFIREINYDYPFSSKVFHYFQYNNNIKQSVEEH